MPFKVLVTQSYSIKCPVDLNNKLFTWYALYIQDLATVDSILLRELPPVDDVDAVRNKNLHFGNQV